MGHTGRKGALALLTSVALWSGGCDDGGAEPELDASHGENSSPAVQDSAVLDASETGPTPVAGDAGLDASADGAADGAAEAGSIESGAAQGRDASGNDGATQDAAAPDASGDGAIQDAALSADAGADAAASGRSAGCGMSATSTGQFAMRTLRVGAQDRVYHLRLPDDYDQERAYALIFRWHGHGGDGLSGGLDIQNSAGEDAIIVGPNGVDQAWAQATESNDLMFFDAMLDSLVKRYCVDPARVFSYGFSMGGGMTNLLGCRRADKLRATAAIAGFDRGTGSCPKPVAAWFLHDQDDDAVLVGEGRGARDKMIARNHCGNAFVAAGGDCVRYQGCDLGYPVIWCETDGLGHNIAGDTAPAQVWDFFRTLP